MIGHVVSVKKMFENNGNIHVYSPLTGTDNPLGSFFFKTIHLLIWIFAASVSQLITL